MAANATKDKETRKQMGFIKFPNRSYPVYEGLNIIGRDPKATIRVKDLIFSKQHAVISVVNENLHFASDFGSSNGTQIKDVICVPFKLYEIKDWDTIIFGDIVGIYHTGIDENSNDQHENATQFNDTIPATQLFTQNIHNKETQPLPNTQLIHDADTQPITSNQQQNIEQHKDKQEKTKLVVNTCENDLYLSKSELFDDIFANDTYRKSFETSESKYNIEIDETLPTDSKTNADNSIDSDDIILSTQDNAMIDKQALEVIQKSEIKTQLIQNDNDDNSATDIEDEEQFVKKIQQQSTQFNTSNLSKNTHNSSDTEIDVDDDLILIKPSKNLKTTIEKEIEDHSDDEELDLMGPTEKLITDLQKETDNDDDLLLVPTQILENKNNSQDSEMDFMAPTQILDKNYIHDIPTQLISNGNLIHEAPTQLIEKNHSDNQKNDDLQKDRNLQKEDPVLDDDAPTQILQNKREECIKKQSGIQDDDNLAPTQLLQVDSNKEEINIDEDAPTQILQKIHEECIEKQPEDNDDDDLAPTQLLHNDNKEIIIDNNDDLPPTQLLQIRKDSIIEIDDIDDDLPPTQLLTTAKISHDDDDLAPTQLLQQPNDEALTQNSEDSIFSAPTQPLIKSPLKKSSLSTNSPKNKKTVNFSEDVNFDLPTQKLSDDNNIQQKITEQNNTPKSDTTDSEGTPKELIISLESNVSLKLVLSDDSIIEKPKNVDTQAETQLEVNFDLETQKIYVEDQTRRPDNPIGNMFDEEPTQNTEDIPKNEDSTTLNKREDIERNRRLEIRLQNMKDLEEASTSTVETAKKKGRPKKSVDTVAENAPKLNIIKDKPGKKKYEDPPVEEKRSTRGKRISYQQLNSGQIELKSQPKKIEKTKTKDVEEENEDDDFQPESSKKKQPEVEEAKQSLRRQTKTLKVTPVKFEDKQKVVDTPKKNEEQELKRSSRRPIKTPVLELENDNSNDFIPKNKQTNTVLETPKKTQVVEEHVTRSSRRLTKTSSNEDKNDDKIDKKENVIEERRSSRRQTRTPAKFNNKSEPKRGKRGHSVAETPKKEEILIEDSSDSETFPVKKKLLKLEYTQDSETPNSEVLKEKPRKTMKIEEYSSDEDSANDSLYSNTKRRKYEPLDVTVTSTQESNVKHKVVFTMLNDTNLENSVKKLGGSVIDSAQNCTILVTNKISRSLKFLVTVALGKPIVSTDWIRDSIKKNCFLDPWNYLLVDKESEAKFKFSLEKSLKRSLQKKLLTNLSFLIAAKKNFDVLKELIETSGGKVITRAPGKNSKAFVVSYEEEKPKYSKYLKQKNLTVVSAEAIFSGVLQQELHFQDHLLN